MGGGGGESVGVLIAPFLKLIILDARLDSYCEFPHEPVLTSRLLDPLLHTYTHARPSRFGSLEMLVGNEYHASLMTLCVGIEPDMMQRGL